ncbi:hypothetical protein [Bacillus licheniformis]|uniref:hypothetical protein n=1 Tax=Bacillus licheniformis TaxID=1402 RepID=UPI003398D9E0
MKIIHKRIYITLIFILLLISGLGARLVQLQLVSTESFTDKKINLIEESVKHLEEINYKIAMYELQKEEVRKNPNYNFKCHGLEVKIEN